MPETSAVVLALSRTTLAALVACGGVAAPVPSAAKPPAGRTLTLSLGGGRGTMSVGDLGRSSFTPSFAASLGLDRRRRFSLLAELQPTGVGNPVAEEAFHATNLMFGFSFGGVVRVQLAAGVQLRRWSGPRRVEESDAGDVEGVSLAVPLRLRDGLDLVPEVVLRVSTIEIEGSVWSSYVGLQLGVRFGRRR